MRLTRWLVVVGAALWAGTLCAQQEAPNALQGLWIGVLHPEAAPAGQGLYVELSLHRRENHWEGQAEVLLETMVVQVSVSGTWQQGQLLFSPTEPPSTSVRAVASEQPARVPCTWGGLLQWSEDGMFQYLRGGCVLAADSTYPCVDGRLALIRLPTRA